MMTQGGKLLLVWALIIYWNGWNCEAIHRRKNGTLVVIVDKHDSLANKSTAAAVSYVNSLDLSIDYELITIVDEEDGECPDRKPSLAVTVILDFGRRDNLPCTQFLNGLAGDNGNTQVTYAAYGEPRRRLEGATLGSTANSSVSYLRIRSTDDVMADVIRDIVVQLNMSNAVVLYEQEIFDMEPKVKKLLRNLPTRHILLSVSGNLNQDEVAKLVLELRDVDANNYFLACSRPLAEAILSAAENVSMATTNFAWFVLLKELDQLTIKWKPESRKSIVVLQPSVINNASFLRTQQFYGPVTQVDIGATFDLVSVLLEMFASKRTHRDRRTVCFNESDVEILFDKSVVDIYNQVVTNYQGSFGNLNNLKECGAIMSDISLGIYRVSTQNTIPCRKPCIRTPELIGRWASNQPESAKLFLPQTSISELLPTVIYQVVTVESPPFIYKTILPSGEVRYKGYCIDLINQLAAELNFKYTLYEVQNFAHSESEELQQIIDHLVNKKAHIGLGPLFVMADRERVVDFTIPFHDLVGMKILMKKSTSEASLFRFLTVMEPIVWLSILGAYFFTSLLLWLIDRFSPFSYQNNKKKFETDPEKREFTLKESFWFCVTSLTPQGGGEAPKNVSGRLVAATWWLFSFIVIASYTANLAAFLTVSRLDNQIDSLDALANQFKIQYSPVNGSGAMHYFERMAKIEDTFFDKWIDMTMSDDLTEEQRNEFTVWDYPVGDKYSKIWKSMRDTGLPDTLQGGIDRIRTSANGYALVGDATKVKYAVMSNCDLTAAGEEFSRRPIALAVQKGSLLKEKLSMGILKMQNTRTLENLKERWWNNNPMRKNCDEEESNTDGIGLKNIGGVFIVIFVGMIMAWFVMAFEFCWFKIHGRGFYKNNSLAGSSEVSAITKMAATRTTENTLFRRTVSTDKASKQYFYSS